MRLRELTELQDAITAARREALIGTTVEVLVDSPGVRPHPSRGAPEIDGMVRVPSDLAAGRLTHQVTVTDAEGPDLDAVACCALTAAVGPGRRCRR